MHPSDQANNLSLVSVLMPAYNVATFIDQAIKSILDQTYQNFELLICDDASTDNTWDIINSYKDSRIRSFRHESNKGYLQTYNFLISQARGNYLTFQDADDWSEKTRLEEQLAPFASDQNLFLTACNGGFYYSEAIQSLCPEFESGVISIKEGNFEFMLPSVLFKREVLNTVKGLHSYFDKLTGGDQYFILDILSQFKGFALNRYLYYAHFNPRSNHRTLNLIRKATAPNAYYLLKQQRLSTGTDWLKEGKDDLLLAYEQSLLDNRVFMSEKIREYAVYRVDSKQLKPAISLLWKAFTLNPLNSNIYRTLFYCLRTGIANV